jgi:hypothetical protein
MNKKEVINIRITTDLKDRIVDLARTTNRTITDLTRDAINSYANSKLAEAKMKLRIYKNIKASGNISNETIVYINNKIKLYQKKVDTISCYVD